jgi:glycosyltransferase involved in cell wall biosynthesis
MSERSVLHVFATFAIGGPQVRAAQVLSLWQRHRHVLIAMDGRTDCCARIAPGVAFELQPPPARRSMLATALAMRARIRALQPALVLTYNWGAIETLLALRTLRAPPAVHHEDGFGPEESERLLRRRSWLRRLLLPRARALVVPSARLRATALGAWRQPASRVRLLRNGVDLQRFQPRPHASRGHVVIGAVGGLRSEKDQQLLLRAYARCARRDAARLVLVGDGPDREALARLAGELGIGGQVEFRGFVTDTAPVYTELDLLALPSRTEQLPIAVLEAMASGLPVVATDVGDLRQVLAAGSERWLSPPGDALAFARSLDEAIGDAALRAELGAHNRARCEQEYEQSVCYGRFVELYEAAVGAGAVPCAGSTADA